MTYTDVLDSRIDAAIRTLRALRTLRSSSDGDSEDGSSVTLREAQRRLNAQIEALAAARALCHRLPVTSPHAHSGPLGTITTDPRGVIMAVGDSVAQLLRRDARELIEISLAELIALPDRRRFGYYLCELIENPHRGEWQTRLNRAGSLICISVALRVEVLPSRLLRWSIRDLRELRRAQSEAFARQESVRGATRLLRRLARESSRLRHGLGPPGLTGA